MSRARIYARSLTANWIGYFANLVVMLFLTRFIVRVLGDTTYGVWSLLVDLTGYLGLIEMGTQAGLGRYINFYLGRDDIPRVNGFVNTALTFFLLVGAVMLMVAGGVGSMFGLLFPRVPAELAASALPALLLIAFNLWLSMAGAIFPLVLTAFDRFDLSNGINLVVLALRAVGAVVVLKNGGGIVSLAVVQVVSGLVAVGIGYVLARRVFPGLRLRLRDASRERFKELFGFSIWAFIAQVGMQLMYWTAGVLITLLLGPAMVTFYTLPLMIIHQGRGVIDNMAGVLGPQTIKASSVEDYHELRHILGWGSKVIMLVAIPLFTGMVFFGREFFVLWMGPEKASCGVILALLAIPQLFVMAIRPGVNIINGLGYVRFGALITLAQGLVNLALTLVFVMVMHWGLEGVAMGMLVPAVIFNPLVAGFVLGWIRYPPGAFLKNNVIRWLLAAAAFCLACWGIAQLPGRDVLHWFALKVLAATAVSLPLGWFLVFTAPERVHLRGRIRSLLPGGRAEGGE